MSKALFFINLIICNVAFADVPLDQLKEVNHLLDYVENSGCIINRNGTDYPANEAIAHIKKKYDYFREDINSTEDFIEYSASKSTMSGKYYMVSCPGEKIVKTQKWLLAELKRYRVGNE
jgi:hypothetical protein